jgi:hypothetical protein
VYALKYTYLRAKHMLAQVSPAIAALPLTRYEIRGVQALKCTNSIVEQTPTGASPAIAALSLTRYGLRGV